MTAMATSARTDSADDERTQMPRRKRRGIGRAGHQPIEVRRDADAAGRDRAAEAGDKRRPAGEKRREAAERLAQIDILAAGLGLPRRELGVGQRAGERQRAAERPHAENRDAARQQRRRRSRACEDADADDVRDDDGGRVERTETAVERGAWPGPTTGLVGDQRAGNGKLGQSRPLRSTRISRRTRPSRRRTASSSAFPAASDPSRCIRGST